jgi:predicted amidophosphoribosyltransferase
MPIEAKHEQRWQYKQEAIQFFAEQIVKGIKLPMDDGIFVPMPTSKPRNHPEFDSRLDDVVKIVRERTEQRIGFNLDALCPSEAFHSSGSSRNVVDISGNISFKPFELPIPAKIMLLDDVVTTGAHFSACSGIIRRHHPEAQIFGLFLAKTIWKSAKEDNENSPL